MANYAFNIAKARAYTFWENVDTNSPTNSALVIVPLSASGTEVQGQDFDDLAAVLGDANFTELTTGSWARVVLTDTELSATEYAVDDTNNRVDLAIQQTSMGSPTAGTTTGILICYDSDTTSGTDSNIIPIVHLDFAVTADSSEVIINAGDVLRAS